MLVDNQSAERKRISADQSADSAVYKTDSQASFRYESSGKKRSKYREGKFRRKWEWMEYISPPLNLSNFHPSSSSDLSEVYRVAYCTFFHQKRFFLFACMDSILVRVADQISVGIRIHQNMDPDPEPGSNLDLIKLIWLKIGEKKNSAV